MMRRVDTVARDVKIPRTSEFFPDGESVTVIATADLDAVLAESAARWWAAWGLLWNAIGIVEDLVNGTVRAVLDELAWLREWRRWKKATSCDCEHCNFGAPRRR